MLTKKEALDVLGLHENSLTTDIETRYATLVKRYRVEQDNEKLEEISLAYNIITGRYVEPAEEDPAMQKMVFGKTRKAWSNIWLYGKFKFLAIAVAAFFVFYLIYTVVTNTPGDFKISAVGDFYISDSEVPADYIISLFPDFKKVDVSSAYIGTSGNGGYDSANEQKAMILVSVSGEDIIILDKTSFERYAPIGAFVDLTTLFDEVSGYDESADLLLSEVKAAVTDSDEVPGEEKVYGIDLSSTQLLSAIGISGRSQILAISVKSERPDLAAEFIRKLIKDSAKLLPKVVPIPPATPTPSPTPLPTVTAAP
ncbi:MAG: hypothetical protein ACYCYM_02590 [Saccharofermentanales bacterium]